MQKKWLILTIIVLIYLPVTIDATVMHVATPSLSAALNLTANQLLWIIDIYSLIMAGLILPMGALGDRIGFKKLLFIFIPLISICAKISTIGFSKFS